jgi:hypothetical protein
MACRPSPDWHPGGRDAEGGTALGTTLVTATFRSSLTGFFGNKTRQKTALSKPSSAFCRTLINPNFLTMNTIPAGLRSFLLLALSAVLLAACGRPYATYQATTPVVLPAVPVASMPVPTPVAGVATAAATTVLPTADLLAQRENTPTDNHRLVNRQTRLQAVLSAKPAGAIRVTKPTLVQKLVLKRLNRAIRQQTDPTDAPTNKQAFRIGLIAVVVGLLLILIGNTLIAALGGVALVGGLALVVLSLLEVI